ncbi:hypothetical protein GGI07_005539 [Coemansia sp. Benny D115]|nr:hypothetical protein GGI07_005539 [Coemansia sp. Benny D115]
MTAPYSFSGKVAVVTGGAQSMGLMAAQALVSLGTRVVIGDIAESGIKEVEEINAQAGDCVAVFQVCNVSDRAQLHSLIDLAIARFGRLDIVINNAGITCPPWQLDPTGDSAMRCINVNFSAVVDATNYAMHVWQRDEAHKGVIINLASMSNYLPTEFYAVYAATKGAVITLTKCYATLAPKVRVNAVAPGWVDTKLIDTEYIGRDHPFVKYAGMLKPQVVIGEIIRLIRDQSLAGEIVLIPNNRDPELCKLPNSAQVMELAKAQIALQNKEVAV